MPSNATRTRIDWCPGDAAIQALEAGESLFPTLNRQSVIDRLLITGLAAYVGPHWQPPVFLGTSRDRWRLPVELTSAVNRPGNRAGANTLAGVFPGIACPSVLPPLQSQAKEPIDE